MAAGPHAIHTETPQTRAEACSCCGGAEKSLASIDVPRATGAGGRVSVWGRSTIIFFFVRNKRIPRRGTRVRGAARSTQLTPSDERRHTGSGSQERMYKSENSGL